MNGSIEPARRVRYNRRLICIVTISEGIEARGAADRVEADRDITGFLSAGLCAVNGEGRVTFVNPATERALGRPRAELLGSLVYEALRAGWAARDPEPLLEAARSGEVVRGHDVFARGDGTTFVAAYTSSPVVEDGRVAGAIFSFRDMTDLDDVSDMEHRFVSTVSHELRTPLTSIKGYLEALLEDEAGPLNGEQREYAETSYRNATRLQTLVDDLLMLSALDAGRVALKAERMDLGALLRQTGEELRPAAEEKGLSLSIVAEPGLVAVGDTLRTSQVLGNLIGNAIKFTPAGRSIRLAARRRADEITAEVADEGPGVPEAELPRLTERFFRASTTTHVPGTGLGLSIAREVIERQGGRLEIESKQGEGSTFRVVLPAV